MKGEVPLIEGVKVKQLIKHHDDRGYFAELVREDESILTQFGQMSLSMSYPALLKPFIIMKNKMMYGSSQLETHKWFCMTHVGLHRRTKKPMCIIWGSPIQLCCSYLALLPTDTECLATRRSQLSI